jgi:uridine phosphorylase
MDNQCAVSRNRDRRRQGRETDLLAVEMEAAALYAFATARQRPVLCMAHVTDQMGQIEGDFEKGGANGAVASLGVFDRPLLAWKAS